MNDQDGNKMSGRSRMSAEQFILIYMEAYNNGKTLHEFCNSVEGLESNYVKIKIASYKKRGVKLPRLATEKPAARNALDVTGLNNLVKSLKRTKRTVQATHDEGQ